MDDLRAPLQSEGDHTHVVRRVWQEPPFLLFSSVVNREECLEGWKCSPGLMDDLFCHRTGSFPSSVPTDLHRHRQAGFSHRLP